MEVDPFIFGHPKLTRFGDRHHDDGTGLIDLHDGVHIFRVRITDVAVVVGRSRDFFRRAGDGEPGLRVFGGHFCEGRHELADLELVSGDRKA